MSSSQRGEGRYVGLRSRDRQIRTEPKNQPSSSFSFSMSSPALNEIMRGSFEI